MASAFIRAGFRRPPGAGAEGLCVSTHAADRGRYGEITQLLILPCDNLTLTTPIFPADSLLSGCFTGSTSHLEDSSTSRVFRSLFALVMVKNVWLVTGASRGLGRALVEELLLAGEYVVAGCRDPYALDDLTKRFGPNALLPLQLDVRSQEQAQDLVTVALDHFGTIDVLVNNAGYSNLAAIEQTPLQSFRDEMEVNLFGVIMMTQAVLPHMRQERKGHIIQISSVGAQATPAGRAPYAAAKCGVEGFSEVLAKEVNALGIMVSIIEPGAFRTDFATTATTSAAQAVMEDYNPTVGTNIERQIAFSGKQSGDPKKAARALMDIAMKDDAPLRVALGSDAFGLVSAKNEARQVEHEKWRALSLSTDFD